MALDDDRVLAVGCITDDGEIALNYVLPEARFRGVSMTLLAELESARSNEAMQCVDARVPKRRTAFIATEDIPRQDRLLTSSAPIPVIRCQSLSPKATRLLSSIALTPSQTAPTKPMTIIVITALNV